jgi:hypothetical protein
MRQLVKNDMPRTIDLGTETLLKADAARNLG